MNNSNLPPGVSVMDPHINPPDEKPKRKRLVRRHRANLADLEARRDHYLRMGLLKSAASVDKKITAMQQVGERLHKERKHETA